MGSTSGDRGVAPGRPACQRAARVLRFAPALSGDTPPVPPLRQQLWALRPGPDGASRPFTRSRRAVSWRQGLGLRARSHSAEAVANAGGFRISLGCTTTSNEEESPLRPTTILRRLLGVTQLNVENGRVAADGPLRSGCGRRGGGHGAGRAAVGRPAMTGGRCGSGAVSRGDGRRCGSVCAVAGVLPAVRVRVERVSWAVGNSAFTAPLG